MSMLLIFSVIMVASSIWVFYTGFSEDILSLMPIGATWFIISSLVFWTTVEKMNKLEEKAAICNPAIQVCEEK